jgi:hypothetical protein
MIEILGYIFAAILTVIAVFILYHIIKGLVVGIDLMRWKMAGMSWAQIRATERYKSKLVTEFLSCWAECIGYNGSITYSRGDKRWEGYGTGR